MRPPLCLNVFQFAGRVAGRLEGFSGQVRRGWVRWVSLDLVGEATVRRAAAGSLSEILLWGVQKRFLVSWFGTVG